MLGTLAAVAPGGEKVYWSVAVQWFLPLICAALAAGVAAHKLGSSVGRVTALAGLALLCAFFIRGVLDYVALYDFVSGAASAGADPGAVRGRLGAFWRWQIMVSFLSIALGGLLGVMFARPDQPR